MDESHLKSLGLNVDRLETELQHSVRHEQRHWHENDAKLRAIEQKVATYDEFRGIVDACELRPLNFKEVQEATKRYAGWTSNPSVIGYSIPKINHDNLPPMCPSIKQCTRIDEFIQCWNALENHQSDIDLVDLLRRQSNELLQEVFASSVGLPILPRVLKCLQVAALEDSASVIRILQTVGSSRNFEITALLMSHEEKTLVGGIFKTLELTTGAPIDEQLRRQWISN